MITAQALPATHFSRQILGNPARLGTAPDSFAHTLDTALGDCFADGYSRAEAARWQCMREIDRSMADGGWRVLMQELSLLRDIDDIDEWETTALLDFKRIATGISE